MILDKNYNLEMIKQEGIDTKTNEMMLIEIKIIINWYTRVFVDNLY